LHKKGEKKLLIRDDKKLLCKKIDEKNQKFDHTPPKPTKKSHKKANKKRQIGSFAIFYANKIKLNAKNFYE
jgi:hypothetical protein